MCAWSSTRKEWRRPSGSPREASRPPYCAIDCPRMVGRSGADAPVHDAMRAVRLLRSTAHRRWLHASARIGVMGFSAGGHLCARLITEPDLAYARRDAADDLSARPDFAVLMYPVIATTGPHAHAGSAQQLQSAGVSTADLDALFAATQCQRKDPAHAARARGRRHQRAGGEFVDDVRRAAQGAAFAVSCIVFDAAAMVSACAAWRARTWLSGRRWFRTGR